MWVWSVIQQKQIMKNSLLIINHLYIYIYIYIWGQKVLEALAHSISSLSPMSRRKKCSRTKEEKLDCQIVLPRMTLSSAGQNHRRERRHIARGNPLEDCKRDSKPYGLAIGAWWRSNPRRSCHLRVKYPQLTPWSLLMWMWSLDRTMGATAAHRAPERMADGTCTWG